MGEYPRSLLASAMDDDEHGKRAKIRVTEDDDHSVSSVSSPKKKRRVAADGGNSELTADDSTTPSSSVPFKRHEELTSRVKGEIVRSSDLKHGDFATEIRTVNISRFSRETRSSTAMSELCDGDSIEFMEEEESASSSITKTKKESLPDDPHRKQLSAPAAAETPSADEIEEFFSAAEKHEQKRFTEKYNYDIVKDVPLEGQYQWVCLKP